MTYSAALDYLLNIPRFSKTLTLERVRFLLSELGNPQDFLRFAHIAGTNGKGSVTTMLSAILTAAGYRTGRFLSPFVEDFRERISIDGQMIAKDALAELTEEMIPVVSAMDDRPNAFEIITALAIAFFQRSGCDVAVLETGLGGRWDATNAIPSPALAVITSIGMDHMQFLGNTPPAIAGEKCGILKPASCAAAAPLQPEGVLDVIRGACADCGIGLYLPDVSALEILSLSLQGTDFRYRSQPYHLRLHGEYQVENAILAIESAQALSTRGFTITAQNIADGIANAYLPARVEVLCTDPLCIVDGAHNVPGIQALSRSLKILCEEKQLITVFGCLQDKNAAAMVSEIAKKSDILICVAPDSPKACLPEELAKLARPHCGRVFACASLEQAVEQALSAADASKAVLVCGSLYLAGPAKKTILQQLEKHPFFRGY